MRILSSIRKNALPEAVFTPRSAEINKTMYIERSDLQVALTQAARSNYHVILFGQSGSGKTWLYKSVLSDAGTPTVVANLANAKRFKSIGGELENLIGRIAGKHVTTSKSSEFEINVADVVRKRWGKNIHLKKIKDPFEELLISLNKAAGNRPTVLVLDNLETIIDDQELMDELGSLIILLDDETYAQYKVKLLVVGVPGDVKEYFQRVKNLKTVANRLIELPEVARMTASECGSLVEKGFSQELEYSVFDMLELKKHVSWVTDRLPQRIHEYCLALAMIAESTRSVKRDMLKLADRDWLRQHLASNVAVVESLMNRPGTKIGRRNQILYSIGSIDLEEFDKSDVEKILREKFPGSTSDRALNVAGMLGELASADEPILRKGVGAGKYRFADARYRMCLRVMLQKAANDQVSLMSPNTLV